MINFFFNEGHFERYVTMKLDELLTINTSMAGQLSKVETEVVAHNNELQKTIDDLTKQMANAELTPEQEASVKAVQAAAQKLDDINADATVVTPPPPAGDTTPPTVPTAIVATPVSPVQVDLSWTASTDDVGVTGYNVFRDGAKVGTPATTTFSDVGLSGGSQFSYTVSAFDAAGNVSEASAAVVATTPL
jgi:hypothetical protein